MSINPGGAKLKKIDPWRRMFFDVRGESLARYYSTTAL